MDDSLSFVWVDATVTQNTGHARVVMRALELAGRPDLHQDYITLATQPAAPP